MGSGTSIVIVVVPPWIVDVMRRVMVLVASSSSGLVGVSFCLPRIMLNRTGTYFTSSTVWVWNTVGPVDMVRLTMSVILSSLTYSISIVVDMLTVCRIFVRFAE